ncbi:MAG: hypothetical protein AB7F96_16960 [Beijerinckiaceae bacterium]
MKMDAQVLQGSSNFVRTGAPFSRRMDAQVLQGSSNSVRTGAPPGFLQQGYCDLCFALLTGLPDARSAPGASDLVRLTAARTPAISSAGARPNIIQIMFI